MLQRKKNPSAFIRNTYNILERSDLDHIITWNEQGNGFIIHDLPKFQAEILPQYFKHQKFTSFVRQLNMYGFHKQRHPLTDNYFQHQTFRRGQNLNEIKRKPQRKKKTEQTNPTTQTGPIPEHKQLASQQNSQNNQNSSQMNNENDNENTHNIHNIEYNRSIAQTKQQQKQQNHKRNQFIYFCQQAIMQNQILFKVHPLLMKTQIKMKQEIIKELKQETDDGDDLKQNFMLLCDVLKAEIMKLASFMDQVI